MLKQYPIVGAVHHKPAVTLLRFIEGSTPLTLRRNPDHKIDPNATEVYIEGIDLPLNNELKSALEDEGFKLKTLTEEGSIILGYIPAPAAAYLVREGYNADGEKGYFILIADKVPGVRFEVFKAPADER